MKGDKKVLKRDVFVVACALKIAADKWDALAEEHHEFQNVADNYRSLAQRARELAEGMS